MDALLAPIPWITLLIAVIAVIAFLYVCWRTQSLHFVVRRFWLLVHGNKDIPDPVVHAFSEEQTSLYAFRLFSGTQVQSLAQAHKLIAWSQQQQIPMATISACGDYFDVEHHRVISEKLPSTLYKIALFFWLSTLIVGMSMSIAVAISSPGLATLKATDRWIVLNEDSVARVFAWPLMTRSLDRGDCLNKKSDTEQVSSFTAAEIKSICNLFEIDAWREYVKKLKKDQRQSLLIIAFIFLFFITIYAKTLNKYYHARVLQQKLTPPKEREIEHATA